ncbi:CLUMA_CG015170, isoform A [Clunio marinus]|uniref:CLUMA_CG015170, isoform A n=1 Tax=Clunio marinus TaxID=568069 RepID=A0A1J1IQB2_9DIPT|nr:CLUMA_CG015170, isoform A [Clunio marinus]
MASFLPIHGNEQIKEKTKTSNQSKQLPKDAQVIISILRDLGINDFEPRVINQLLEFTYRYVTTILDDAKVYASHSKKKGIDLEDVKLASTMLLDKSFTGPPPREVLLEVAKQKNSQPLPTIKPHSGIRLPPDRHCLLAANYKLRAATSQAPTKKLVKSALADGMSTVKTKLSTTGSSSPSGAATKKPTLGQTVKAAGQSIVSIPKPVFKVAKPIVNKPRPLPTSATSSSHQQGIVTIKMDTDSESSGLKRKRSDDFDSLS